MTDRNLLIAIHDLTPAHAQHLESVFALEQHGVPRYALLVVPDWHGCWPLEADEAFEAQLRERRRSGAELFHASYPASAV
jgi:predicted deacetylase